jgi:hypothetical protein
MALRIDGLTAAEMRSLSAFEQAECLSDLLTEIGALGRLRRSNTDQMRDTKKAVLRAVDRAARDAAKLDLLDAQAMRDGLKIEMDYRKDQVKILQTLLRAIPA